MLLFVTALYDSGKTLSMTIGFILWSLENYQNQNFAICGKTIASIRRNIVMQLKLWLGGICEIVEHRSQNYIDISIRGKKRIGILYLEDGMNQVIH